MMRPLTLGVCPDFVEERWPSMDRAATQLLSMLETEDAVATDVLRPPFVPRAPRWCGARFARSVDRAWNRFVEYPRHISRAAGDHDVYHVIDHSYAHLVRSLPAGRTVVTCHDLDAFRSIHEQAESRSAPFRAATRYILGGLRRAAAVACDTTVIGDELVRRGVVAADRIVVVPLGIGEVFTPAADPVADDHLVTLLPVARDVPVVLHVGTAVPRKRIDLLLRFVARLDVSGQAPHLVRVGEPFTGEQAALVRDLGLQGRITVLSAADDRLLAAAYRRASVVVLPSDREGFGLPVLEALKSGAAVVATDLPVLREVGGPVTRYCPAGDVKRWAREVTAAITEPSDAAARSARVQWAESFTWRRYADQMLRVYAAVAAQPAGALAVQAPA
jgi:glycosyltransferase involved in cell wall biosynthesis